MFMIRQFSHTDIEDIVSLWELCGLSRPWNNAEIDIFRKTEQNDGLFLVALRDEQLVATVMGGYDGHRGGSAIWPFIRSISVRALPLHWFSN